MTDYRTMFPKDSLGAWDLGGREVVVTIETVKPGTVGGHSGKKKDHKAIITFKGKRKHLICNKTNAATIANLYGPHVEKWVGMNVTLFPTTTTFGRDTVDCIRVKPTKPGSVPDTTDSLDREVDPDMRGRQNDASEGADDAHS